MKGTLQPDHMPVNKFSLAIAGVIPLTITAIKGLKEEMDSVDLPDRTRATGGRTKALTFEIMVPAHHTAEINFWKLWWQECQDPVSPTYKKPCTLAMPTLSGQGAGLNFTLVGVFMTAFGLPDGEMKNEGEMAEITIGMSADDLLPM